MTRPFREERSWLVTVTGHCVWGATQNSATCCRELHCSQLNHPSKLFPSVLASVCLCCLWSFRWQHVLSSHCTSVYFSVWHSSRHCILHDFFMPVRSEFHTALEDSCLLGCDAVSRLCFWRFEGSTVCIFVAAALSKKKYFFTNLRLGCLGLVMKALRSFLRPVGCVTLQDWNSNDNAERRGQWVKARLHWSPRLINAVE
jgi:hypothetical protein